MEKFEVNADLEKAIREVVNGLPTAHIRSKTVENPMQKALGGEQTPEREVKVLGREGAGNDEVVLAAEQKQLEDALRHSSAILSGAIKVLDGHHHLERIKPRDLKE